MFTKTFRHTPGPELMGNAIVLFAIAVTLHLLGSWMIAAAMQYVHFGFRVDLNALVFLVLIRIPAYILYFVSAMMGVLGIASSAIERNAGAHRS